MTDLAPGTVIAEKYRIGGRLGGGGQGVVYEAEHITLGQPVAIKVLSTATSDDLSTLGRFEREARVVAKLTSPFTVRVFDFGTLSSGVTYLVMERLVGEPLSHLLADPSRREASPLIQWTQQICAALDEAHGLGIVHRDLKPANIFITPTATVSVARVLDFGLATDPQGTSLTATGMVAGTPHFMAPEQIFDFRNVDGRADLFSLGVILYLGLSGHYPYAETNLSALAIAHATRPPTGLEVLVPGLPRGLAACVMKAISPSKDDRYPDARAFADALGPYSDFPTRALQEPAVAHRSPTIPGGRATLSNASECLSPPRRARPRSGWARGLAVGALSAGVTVILGGGVVAALVIRQRAAMIPSASSREAPAARDAATSASPTSVDDAGPQPDNEPTAEEATDPPRGGPTRSASSPARGPVARPASLVTRVSSNMNTDNTHAAANIVGRWQPLCAAAVASWEHEADCVAQLNVVLRADGSVEQVGVDAWPPPRCQATTSARGCIVSALAGGVFRPDPYKRVVRRVVTVTIGPN